MQNALMVLAQQPGGSQGGNPMGMLIAMGLIFAIFYFMLIRPQQRREKERRKTIETLRAGQRVLFGAGFIGTIVEVHEYTFLIEIAKGTVVEVARGAVSKVLSGDAKPTLDDQRG